LHAYKRKVNREKARKRKVDRRVAHKSRDSFRSHTSISWDPAARRVAVYGDYVPLVHVRQRYRIRRRDGHIQRYWKKTKRMMQKGPVKSGRYEFYGRGKTLYKAIRLAHRVMPEGFVGVSAEEFLRNPYKYGVAGFWIDREVES